MLSKKRITKFDKVKHAAAYKENIINYNVPKRPSKVPKMEPGARIKEVVEGKVLVTITVLLSIASIVIVAIPYDKVWHVVLPMLAALLLYEMSKIPS